MPRLNNDDQFKFLISCIRWSNNGKIDFVEVAKECSVVTKGAAAKRYERLMKAHGIHQPAASRDTNVTPLRSKDEPGSSSAKKRKQAQFEDSNNGASDDDEGLCRVKAEKICTKPEKNTVKKELVKTEAVKSEDTSHEAAPNYPWLRHPNSTAGPSLADESTAFSDFISPDAFDPINPSQHFEDASAMSSGTFGSNHSLGEEDVLPESILIVD